MAKRLLWISTSAPDHEGGGDQLRQAYLLDQVGQSFDVTLVAPQAVTDAAVAGRLRNAVRVPFDGRRPVLWNSKVRRLGQAAFARDPIDVTQTRELRQRIAELLPELIDRHDVAVVEHLELAPLGQHLNPLPRALTVHLSHSRLSTHRAEVAGSAREAWFWRRDAQKAARLERSLGSSFDLVIAASTEDRAVLGGEVTVIGNGVDIAEFEAADLPSAPRVVFTGSLDYAPNQDAMRWFLRAIWPAVKESIPQATLDIVGRNPKPELLAAVDGQRSVTLHANVEAIAPWIEQARVVVVPVRLGAGTRLKALQGLAARRIVVGTSIGLEGLGLINGETALIADAADDLAAAVIEALRGNGGQRIADAGRDHVARHFSWRELGERLTTQLEALR